MTSAYSADQAPLANTSTGMVRGLARDGINVWLGVPYAAPPERFAPPQPAKSWDGVADATDPGDCAPHQIESVPGIDVAALVGHGGLGGRDYLRLNVWAPAGAQGRPVMVFIHGGGFVIGSKDAPVQDGANFARSGVVCVAINYRLGIDGFLPVPGTPTNLGLRDMLFALQWVQRNIAAFGGDPANVTVFGESAGAMAIADLVTSPMADGLFRRAIIQSGHGSMVREIPVAQRVVRKLAKVLRITPDARGFQSVSDEAAFMAIRRIAKPTARLDLRDAAGHEPVFGISRFIPVFGDDVLPSHPLAALRDGRGRQIDVLIGTNTEEMNLYFVPSGVRRKLKGVFGGLFARWFIGKSHPAPRAVLRDYAAGHATWVGEVFTRALSDLVFRWPARQYAAAHQGRTWMYEFDWRSTAFAGELGACHAIELPFVFNSLAVAAGPQGFAGENPPQDLADHVHGLWVRFATDGTLPWAEFTEQSREVYQLGKRQAVHEPPMLAAKHLPE